MYRLLLADYNNRLQYVAVRKLPIIEINLNQQKQRHAKTKKQKHHFESSEVNVTCSARYYYLIILSSTSLLFFSSPFFFFSLAKEPMTFQFSSEMRPCVSLPRYVENRIGFPQWPQAMTEFATASSRTVYLQPCSWFLLLVIIMMRI